MTEQVMQTAREQIERFILPYPVLQLWENTPMQSATNQVFYGACDGERVVFKYFKNKARKWQEKRALEWLAASGVVPQLYPFDSENILTMQCLPGQMLWQAQQSSSAATLTRLYHQVGAGLARLVKHAHKPAIGDAWQNPYAPDDAFWSTRFDEYFDTTLDTCVATLQRHQFDQPALLAAARNLQAARNEVMAWPTFMHGDDVSGANTMVEGAIFQGFIDFEMSRLGNELYLLGTALQWACLDNPSQWAPMRAGYEAERGAPMEQEMVALLKLFAPFFNWCRFAWWWGSDDQPAWVWERNARGRTLNELLKTIAVVDSVVG